MKGDIFMLTNKMRDLRDNGVYNAKKHWYLKYEYIHRIIRVVESMFILLCIGTIACMVLVESVSTKEMANGQKVHMVQMWNDLDKLLDDALLNYDPRRGTVIWVGPTISAHKAMIIAQRRLKLFNAKVETENEDYKAGIKNSVDPMFEKKRDVYYIKDEDGTQGFFIVEGGTKILGNDGKPLNQSKVSYRKLGGK